MSYNNYLRKGREILDKHNIKVKDISTKKEIQKSKHFVATLNPTEKIIIK